MHLCLDTSEKPPHDKVKTFSKLNCSHHQLFIATLFQQLLGSWKLSFREGRRRVGGIGGGANSSAEQRRDRGGCERDNQGGQTTKQAEDFFFLPPTAGGDPSTRRPSCRHQPPVSSGSGRVSRRRGVKSIPAGLVHPLNSLFLSIKRC